jgi:hypothetical protein
LNFLFAKFPLLVALLFSLIIHIVCVFLTTCLHILLVLFINLFPANSHLFWVSDEIALILTI